MDEKISSRPSNFEERFRLYIDESGDHVFRDTHTINHRYLCLLGCWIKNPAYLDFHDDLESIKRIHIPHHPDEPVILHREDIVHARKVFKVFRDPVKRAAFDQDLLNIIAKTEFRMTAVIIDKDKLREQYGAGAGHPYNLGLGFLLQRYAGYLNHINRTGDVMAEARGGVEDRLLKESYSRVHMHGAWITRAGYFQAALTSQELKIKQKKENIAGLQLADLLVNPAKMWVLNHYELLEAPLPAFVQRLSPIMEKKFNCHDYTGQKDGYGFVIYPKK